MGPKSQKLVGTRELAELLGVSRQYAWRLTLDPAFPKPVHDLYMGFVWDLRAVREHLMVARPVVGGREVKDSLKIGGKGKI